MVLWLYRLQTIQKQRQQQSLFEVKLRIKLIKMYYPAIKLSLQLRRLLYRRYMNSKNRRQRTKSKQQKSTSDRSHVERASDQRKLASSKAVANGSTAMNGVSTKRMMKFLQEMRMMLGEALKNEDKMIRKFDEIINKCEENKMEEGSHECQQIQSVATESLSIDTTQPISTDTVETAMKSVEPMSIASNPTHSVEPVPNLPDHNSFIIPREDCNLPLGGRGDFRLTDVSSKLVEQVSENARVVETSESHPCVKKFPRTKKSARFKESWPNEYKSSKKRMKFARSTVQLSRASLHPRCSSLKEPSHRKTPWIEPNQFSSFMLQIKDQMCALSRLKDLVVPMLWTCRNLEVNDVGAWKRLEQRGGL